MRLPSPESAYNTSANVTTDGMHVHEDVDDTCLTSNSQFEYMSKFRIGGVKKTKKIKRKYEMKNRDSNSSNTSEKPFEQVVYTFMENQMLSPVDVHKNSYFNYSKDQHVSIIRVDASMIGKRGKRSVDSITDDEMIRLLHLTQQQACNVLGCSLSTLKRKFYQIKEKIGIDKWPHNYLDYRKYDFFENFYPLSLKYILNNTERE